MDDLTGKQLGPYQIVAPLGEGGMAAVYRAFQPSVNRYVAVKVLPQYFARDPQFAARFEREAQLLAQLQHPNILPVFDYGHANDEAGAGRYTYIAMPLIKGGSLEAFMHSQRLDHKAIRKVITQVGDALDYAHSLNLIHRDVKPANILIDERGNCLLTDFGLARMVEGTAKLTSSGTIMGTPVYMSPEQGKGLSLDRRTDIYSLGIILYELAVGRAPFEADTPMVVVVKHINDPLPLPGALIPNFPKPLERVIVKALAKDRNDRYPTAAAFVEAVNAAFDEIDSPGSGTASIKEVFTKPPITSPAAPSVVAASPRAGTAVPPPANQSLVRRAWWMFPLGGFALLVVLVVVGGAGAFALNQFLKRTPTSAPPVTSVSTVSTQAPDVTEEATAEPEPTALIATQVSETELLNEDFEDGEAQDWIQLTGDGTSEIIALPDGNHVAHTIQGDTGGISIYSPSFSWEVQDYTVELDVMVVDPEPGQTSIRLSARIPEATVEQACLGYSAVLGAGWTDLIKTQADGNNCDASEWQEKSLAPDHAFELNSEEWHHLRLDVQGTTLQYSVDGTLVASAEDFVDAWRTGGIGLSAYHFKEIYIDNLQVHTHPEPLDNVDAANWTVTFSKYFAPNNWSEGTHPYTFNLACPGMDGLDNNVSQQFEVAASDPPAADTDYLFLTKEGLSYQIIDGEIADSVDPNANTVAAYNLTDLTQAQANEAVIRCDATMSWDDGSSDTLQPAMLFQH